MKTTFLRLIATLLLATATPAFSATNDLSSALQKGLFEEEANHNLDAAIAAYQSVAAQFDKDRKLAATAIFRLGEVYRKQGKTNEANAQYERILKEFPDQTTLVDLSRTHSKKTERSGTSKIADGTPPVFVSHEDAEITRIKAMIKDSPDLINAPAGGKIPLHQAAQNNWLKVAEFLLANGADVNRSAAGSSTFTALHLAVERGHKSMVEFLLAKGADTESREGSGGTALHIASGMGFKAIAEILLQNKANVNAKNNSANSSQTPLHLAVQAGHRAIVETLLANGANVNARDDGGRTPLYVALGSKNLEMAKFLIAQKADVNAATKNGETPLHSAIIKQDSRFVELLLQNGANVELKLPKYKVQTEGGGSYDALNFTALHIAAHLGQTEIANLLLAAKADPNATNHYGATPLHYAAGNGYVEVTETLLKSGALVDFIDVQGSTPLFWALMRAHKGTAELLLANKADPNIQNQSGDTPLGFVKKMNSPAREELIAVLLRYGANENFERLTRISTIRAGKENPVFSKGNQPLNRYTLIELIVQTGYPFPDLANVKIDRLDEDGKMSRIIPVNVEEMLKSGDCTKNIWLEWGDVVEIPELDHLVNAQWYGYPKAQIETMQKCLQRTVSISVKGETTNITLNAIALSSPVGNTHIMQPRNWFLTQIVSNHLRASSDRGRIKVKRTDPVTKQSHQIIVNVEFQFKPDLWLLDGDVIEIPERDPNAPAPTSSSSQSGRSIPTRTLKLPSTQPSSPVQPD